MSEDLVTYESHLQTARRTQIQAFEAWLTQHPEAVQGDSEQFPLVHRFAPGVYVREIFIPAGSLLTGKLHKQAHPVFLMQGAIRVYTEGGGMQELVAPLVFIAPAGTKRAALALEDTVWVTVHATSSTDLEAIEAEVIAPSFEALEQWRAQIEAGATPPLDRLPSRSEGCK